MFFKKWMSFIKEDTLLRKLVMPGSHNAGSYGMKKLPRCQNGNMFEQYEYGARQFCIRLHTDRKGVIRLAHGVRKGDTFENGLKDLKRILDDTDTEFFIFDIRKYYTQKIGPLTLKFRADPKRVDELLAQYICPEKYALTDFDVKTLTLGQARASGKRYILINEQEEYKFSTSGPCIRPWQREIYGSPAEKFLEKAPHLFAENEAEGFYWCETQQTPNIGSELGLTHPRDLEKAIRPLYHRFIDTVAENPAYLEKANIMGCDFLTDGYYKSAQILRLNLLKNFVKESLIKEYSDAVEYYKDK